MFKFSSLVLLMLLYASSYEAAELKLSLYYETLCPYCRNFITNQLYDTYKLLGDDWLNVDLVPCGWTKVEQLVNGTYVFTCQHGENECHGNLYHGCAVAHATVAESIEFVYCSEKSGEPGSDQILAQCSEQAGINWDNLKKCYDSGEASELLVKNGERTQAVEPPIQGVPTIIFNDKYNGTFDEETYSNLLKVVCDLLDRRPNACSNF